MPVPIRNPKKTKSTKPVHIKRVKEVVFDEDARKEYLTGFSKRKKARELVARNKAIDREREELNESRREVSCPLFCPEGFSMSDIFFPLARRC